MVVEADMSPRALKKRAEILDAAADVFRDEGYEAASMDRIAERAGASKRTVYNHFASKEALFHAVFEQFFAEVSVLNQVAWDPERSLQAQLADFARAKSEVIADPRWRGLMLVGLGVCVRDPAFSSKTVTHSKEGENNLVEWLRAAHKMGHMSVPDPKLAADLFWSMVSGAVFWPQLFEGPMPVKVRRRIVAEVVETFLCRFGT
jgi:TetR/AcrR family transcriptional regulator of autoinduction and epiphytic fitness